MDGDWNWIWWLVAVFVLMSVFKGGHQHKSHRRMQEQIDELHRAPPPAPPAPPALSGPTRAEVERLEQRVRVLERIVTDSGYTLASQIEALRDDRPVERRIEARHEEEKI